MIRAEVFDLLLEIKSNYPSFDVSDDNVDRHYKYLQDFPFPEAMKNVELHIKTDSFPPKIADIRGRLGDLMDSQRSKEEAAAYEVQLEEWASENKPPPEGFWEQGRQLLRGEG